MPGGRFDHLDLAHGSESFILFRASADQVVDSTIWIPSRLPLPALIAYNADRRRRIPARRGEGG
jgi:hypothetical protein